jgi:hypothetical protein
MRPRTRYATAITPAQRAADHRARALDGGARRLNIVLNPDAADDLALIVARGDASITATIARLLAAEANRMRRKHDLARSKK